MSPRLEVLVAPIETLAVDAVVNAANARLLPGAGVDGALRRAAGPALTHLTATLPPLPPGEAVITPGFNAPARFIIHTAAPVWNGGESGDAKCAMLAACYRSAILIADAEALRSLAFPCLGAGIYGWPRDSACEIALRVCASAETTTLERIVFCCFSEDDAAPYRQRLL